jgi:SpoVK/Ycf46/Vps4 family AAA+-type ATPase
MEDHNGLVILASNLKDNIDKAFLRRFQSTVHFPMPGADERYRIWQQSLSRELPPAKEVNLRDIAEKYALSGGLMMNVVRYCTLKAMKYKKNTICLADIEYGIKRELHKDGIIFTK